MYDNLLVHRVTADETGPSNALVAGGIPLRVHKVVLTSTGADQATLDLHDDINSSAATAIKVSLRSNLADGTTYNAQVQQNFNPPVGFGQGLSINIGGTGAVAYIYYTK